MWYAFPEIQTLKFFKYSGNKTEVSVGYYNANSIIIMETSFHYDAYQFKTVYNSVFVFTSKHQAEKHVKNKIASEHVL